MGGGSWKDSTWNSYKRTSGIDRATNASDIYSRTTTKAEWLPYNVIRESCDSEEHPNSTPIILGLDVTGSMSRILHIMADKLGVTMGEIYKRDCVPDPQVCFAAVDDYITSDNEALQVTQFESDIRIAEQMKEIKFIQRGGGNSWESYALAWYFAAKHTKCDAIKKGRNGIIITMGDDGFQPTLSREEIEVVFGDKIEKDIDVHTLINELNRDWEIFHLNLAEGGSYSTRLDKEWNSLLGTHAITVENVDKLPEIIVSILQTVKGDSLDSIVKSWDGSTAVAVQDALSGLTVVNNSGTGAVLF